jgi:hypothetical protein
VSNDRVRLPICFFAASRAKPASTGVRLCSLLRLGFRFAHRGRLYIGRLSGTRGCRLAWSEELPALGRELGFLPHHAGGNPINVGNLGAAEAECVGTTRLLLLGGIGMADRGPKRERKRYRECSASPTRPDGHEFPQQIFSPRGYRVNGGEFASTVDGRFRGRASRNDHKGACRESWYSWVDSNHRPPDPQSGALTN